MSETPVHVSDKQANRERLEKAFVQYRRSLLGTDNLDVSRVKFGHRGKCFSLPVDSVISSTEQGGLHCCVVWGSCWGGDTCAAWKRFLEHRSETFSSVWDDDGEGAGSREWPEPETIAGSQNQRNLRDVLPWEASQLRSCSHSKWDSLHSVLTPCDNITSSDGVLPANNESEATATLWHFNACFSDFI